MIIVETSCFVFSLKPLAAPSVGACCGNVRAGERSLSNIRFVYHPLQRHSPRLSNRLGASHLRQYVYRLSLPSSTKVDFEHGQPLVDSCDCARSTDKRKACYCAILNTSSTPIAISACRNFSNRRPAVVDRRDAGPTPHFLMPTQPHESHSFFAGRPPFPQHPRQISTLSDISAGLLYCDDQTDFRYQLWKMTS